MLNVLSVAILNTSSVCVKKYERLAHVLIVLPFGWFVNHFLMLLANQTLWLLCHTFCFGKLLLNVVIDQLVLYHDRQIGPIIIWADKSNWTRAPTTIHNKLVIPTPVILIVWIKRYKRATVEFEFTHDP